METEASQKLPIFVRVIALLLFAGGIVAIVRAVLFVANPAYMALPPYVRMSVPGSIILGAIVNMLCARGLLRRRRWARVVVCIFYAIGTVLGIARGIHAQSMGYIIAGLLSFIIFYYLLTAKEVRWAFKK